MKNILPYIAILADLFFNLLIVNNIINPNIIKYCQSDFKHIIPSVNIAFAIFIPFIKFLKPSYTDMYSLLTTITLFVQLYNTYHIIYYCTILFISYPLIKQINKDYRFKFNTIIMLIFTPYTLIIYLNIKFLQLNV